MFSLLQSLWASPLPVRRDEGDDVASHVIEFLEARVMLTDGNLSPVVDTTAFPNSAVVQFEMTWDTNNNGVRDAGDTTSSCSGALVSEYHVLTAGHCIYDRGEGTNATGGLGYADWIEVFAGRNGADNKPFGVANAVTIRAPDLWTTGTTADWEDGDIGLITLDRPLGAHAGFLNFAAVDDTTLASTDLSILHYPGNFGFSGEEQYHSGPFRTTGESAENFTYSLQDAWTTGGSSGSPIFAPNITIGGTPQSNVLLGIVARGDFVAPGEAGTDTATRVGHWFNELTTWIASDPAPTDRAALYDYDEWFGTETSNLSSLSVPSSGNLSVSARVFNGGTEAASNFLVRFYASTDTSIDPGSDTFLGDDIVSVNPYEFVTANWSGQLPASLADGNYYIGWSIDPTDAITEFDDGADTSTHVTRVAVGGGFAPDSFEENDSFATAHDFGRITSAAAASRTIDTAGDDDYYTFTALGTGSAVAGITFAHADGNLDLMVYGGPSAIPIGRSTSVTDDELVTFDVTAGETYYVRVFGEGGVTNSYDMLISAPDQTADALEANDTSQTATQLPTIGASQQIDFQRTLSIHSASDEDWFVFEVTATSADVIVELDFLHAAGDLDFDLYRVNSGQLDYLTGSYSEDDNEALTETLSAGRYAIVVYGYLGARNLYEFRFRGADPTGDPLTDIIGRTSSGTWWVGESDGSSFSQRTFGRWGNTNWQTTQYADFNGDGHVDVASQASNGTWWVGLSDGTRFSTSSWGRWSTTAGWQDISVGDFNGDGMTDIVGRSSAGTWWVGLSTGSGFQTSSFGRWGGSWTDIQYADFNGDGVTDIAARSSNGTWWIGQTFAGRFYASATARWSTTAGWQDISTGDFNGDGRADVIGRSASGTWWVGLSDFVDFRTGLLTSAFDQWTGSGWQDVQYADFDNDGRTDIAGRSSSGTWRVGLSDGVGFTTSSWSNWNSSAGWHNIMTGDFNGDGMVDVAGRTSSGTWWVGISDGSRFVTSAFGHWSTGVTWADPGAANFV